MLLKDLNERSVTQLSSSAIDSWLVVGDLVSHALVRKRLINDGICDEYVLCDLFLEQPFNSNHKN